MEQINKLVQEAHENAKEKGWHDADRSFGELIALCHSELSEALEEHRNGHDTNKIYYPNREHPCSVYEENKPEGIPIELADVIIRIFDMCGKYEIDLDAAINIKMEYNKTRPYKHGGKVI